jgi:DNA polymerase III epsilon subunit-like protein
LTFINASRDFSFTLYPITMSSGQDLAERISEPVVPQEVQRDITVLEQQFVRAEVEQCKFVCALVKIRRNHSSLL